MRALQGMLLDVDGTLVLSNDAHAQSWVEAYREHGYDIAFERVRRLIGMGGDRLVETVTPDLHTRSGEGKAIADRRAAIFLSRHIQEVRPAPGARALIERFHRMDVLTVVASSAQRDELDALLKAAGVSDLLRTATTKDDVSASKPAPDTVQSALEKASLPPGACAMLGDTPYDVESAARAGVAALAVRCGGWGDSDLKGAIAIFDDPADLLAHLGDPPLSELLSVTA